MFTLGRTKYKLRVLYKSGNAHEFWTTEFTIKAHSMEWVAANSRNRPLMLGFDNIEAVYHTGTRLSVWPFWSKT